MASFAEDLTKTVLEGSENRNTAALYNKQIQKQLEEENLKASKPPSGIFETYITNDDSTHKKFGNDLIDGKDSTSFKTLKTINADGEIVDAKIGVPTQRYTGKLNLDPGNPNFGTFDFDHGFHNVNFPTLQWDGIGRYKPKPVRGLGFIPFGNFVWGNSKGEDYDKWESIMEHPNTKSAVIIELHKLNQYANKENLDKQELLKRIRLNNNKYSEFLAEEFEKIIENKDIEYELDENSNFVSRFDEENSEKNNSLINDIDFSETSNSIKVDETDFSFSQGFAEVLEDAGEEFLRSFGVSKDESIALKYPHDAVYGLSGELGGQDHIIIEQFQYKAPQSNLINKSITDKASTEDVTSLYLQPKLREQRNSVLRKFMGVVKMPIPNNLSFTNGVGWGDGRANPLELAAFMSANSALNQAFKNDSILDGFKSIGSDIKEVISDIGDGALSGSAGEAISAIASQFLLGRAGINVDANQMLARTVGVNINPNLELLFNGPKLRNFSFSFNFAPNDELDGSVMRRIQRFFKQGMAPIRNRDNLIFLGSPNIFRIRYRTNESTRIGGLPMHKLCALTACEINFTPDGVYQSYDDSSVGSSPVRTIMNLNFSELTPLFQDDYLNSDSDLFGDPTVDNESLKSNGVGAFRSIGLEDTGF